jgi:DNA-binding transcriptional LysR family regulator
MANWEGINEFVAVAQTSSFTMASKKLAISTAQVSRQVSAIEKRLNIKLFYRTTRKVSLTQEGEVFYQHCRGVLDGLTAAEQAISTLQSKPQGLINLSAPVTYGEQKILPLLNDFVQLHSEIEVNTSLTNHRVDLVDGGFDLVIRLGQLDDSNLIASKLSSRANFVCATPHYLAKHGEPDSLAALNNHNCLLGTRDFWRFSVKGKEKQVRVSGNIRCNSGIGLVDAALKHIGIVQLPDYYVEQRLESGELTTLLSQYQEPDEGIWAVYPQNKYLSPRIRLLIDYLKAQLATHDNK